MRKPILFVLISFCLFIIAGCGSLETQKSKKLISNYYEAIKNKAYEEAFLHIDHFYSTEETTIDTKKVKDLYRNKTKLFEKINYELVNYEIVNVDKGKYEVTLTVLINGETFNWKETVSLNNELLIIETSEDKYVKYRDGQIDILLVDNLPQTLIKELQWQIGKDFKDFKFYDLDSIQSLYMEESVDTSLLFQLLPNVNSLNIVTKLEDWSSLEHLEKLTTIVIQDVSFDQPIDFSKLTKLEYIYLYNCNINHFETLTNLKGISLYNIDGFDFSTLEEYKELINLTIINSKLESLEPISTLHKLEALTIAEESIKDITPLKDLSNLYFIDIIETSIESIKPIEHLPALQHLLLDMDKVKDWKLLENREEIMIGYGGHC